MFLLDTNTCIGHLTGRSRNTTDRLRALSPDEIVLCSVVKAELLAGAWKSSRTKDNLVLLARFFEPFASLAFDDLAADVCGRLRADLERQGRPIGPNDLLIASIAVAHGLVVVTSNKGEFERVPNLAIEDWA